MFDQINIEIVDNIIVATTGTSATISARIAPNGALVGMRYTGKASHFKALVQALSTAQSESYKLGAIVEHLPA